MAAHSYLDRYRCCPSCREYLLTKALRHPYCNRLQHLSPRSSRYKSLLRRARRFKNPSDLGDRLSCGVPVSTACPRPRASRWGFFQRGEKKWRQQVWKRSAHLLKWWWPLIPAMDGQGYPPSLWAVRRVQQPGPHPRRQQH
jgi:hypothetical protein